MPRAGVSSGKLASPSRIRCTDRTPRSSLPPLGEAEWRGGVGVGGGWARRDGDENGAAVGPGQPSTPAPHRRRSVSGKRPPPRSGPRPESALPATRFASGGREVRAADLQCVNAVALMGRTDSTEGWRAGHRPLGRSRPPRHKPQGQAASDPSGLGPLRLTRPRASSTRRSMPGDPPPRSAFGPVGPPSLLICNSPAHRGEGGVRHPRRFESPEPRKTRPRASGWGRWSRLTAFADRL
jgi:hypothetical protein